MGELTQCILIFAIISLIARSIQLYILTLQVLPQLPGPVPLPFIGSGHWFIGANTNNIYSIFKKLMTDYGKQSSFKIWIKDQLYVVLTKPEDLRALYNNQSAKNKTHSVYRFLESWFGKNSLLLAPVYKWKPHRRIITMTFTQTILDKFVEIFAKNSQNLVTALNKRIDKDAFDVFPDINVCTLKSVCETVMGVKVQDDINVCKYLEALQMNAQISYMKICKFWLHYDFIYNRTKMREKELECLKILHSFSNMIYDKKEETYEESIYSVNDNDKLKYRANPEKKPLLNFLFDIKFNKIAYNKEEIIQDINIFLAAGSETTAIVSSFTLIMLAIHQEIQESVYNELSLIFGNDRLRLISAADLKDMCYLEMVVKETMRLFPTVPIVARTLGRELTLRNTTIPAGSCCVAAPLAVHYDPEVWSEPESFNPERFRPAEKYKRQPYSFIPFSGGLRNCIGRKFAFMSTKTLLASILREYRVETDIRFSDIQLKVEITMKSANGYPIRIIKRRLGKLR